MPKDHKGQAKSPWVGEGWVSETVLYKIVRKIFQDDEVIFHHRPEWLQGLEIDIFIPRYNLAIEYQGKQHFQPVEHWGGKQALLKLQKRDKKKADLCTQNDIELITINYDETLSEERVRKKIDQVLKEFG